MSGTFGIPAPAQYGRTWLVISIFFFIFLAIVVRLYSLQIVQGPELRYMGERQQIRDWVIPAARGSILDSEGMPLVNSEPRWSLFADPDYITNKTEACVQLHKVLGISRDRLRKDLNASSNGRLLMRGINDDQKKQITELRLDGIYLRRSFEREYPHGSIAPHVIGWVRKDHSGGAGVEQRFNAYLGGTNGQERVHVNAFGQPVLLGQRNDADYIPARPGCHIQLTLNAEIQMEAERALQEAVERHEAKHAALVAIRPSNGAIVAMASYPHFDILEYNTIKDPNIFRNQVLQFVYESGSTMKPLMAGAAVADGVASWDEQIYCEKGRWTYREGRRKRTIHDHSFKYGGHEMLTINEGIAKSDNILMAKLGLRLGPEKLYDWTKRFGFGSRSGIHLPGEDAGIVLPKSRWNRLGSCMSVPMGHELAVTPLQMALMHAAVANRGIWNPPRLIERIYRIDEETGEEIDVDLPPLPDARVIFSERDAMMIQDAMNLTMTEGTGKKLQIDGYTSAGKTGTTEKLVKEIINGKSKMVYADDRHIGSFICWAPAEHYRMPEIVVLGVVDDPQKNGYYGSQTAGPAVQRVINKAMEVFKVAPSYPKTEKDVEIARQ